MTTHSPPRRTAAILTTLAVAAGTLLLPTAAIAAEGAAPTPTEYRVIAGVHTDAVSTFLDDGQLALGSKADVAEGSGTRFAADEVWFHLEDAAQQTLPAGYEFIAPAGSTVWMAPESNPGTGRLWPGFNTESIAPGAIENDTTTFTLTGFDGPGDLELFTSGVFGEPERLWSSRDASLRTFDIGRTHMHANWAFTAPGTYRLDVEGTATIGGAPQTVSATYTFVVGDLPDVSPTTTTLLTSANSLVVGDAVTLTAHVTPVDVEGAVEFRDGSTVIGHEPVAEGQSDMTVTSLGIGSHSITAHFVPAVTNLAHASASEAVSVTVTDADGGEFAVTGIESSYQPGDVLTANVQGVTLGENQAFRWHIRPVGSEITGRNIQTGVNAGYTMPVSAAENGFEISVSLRDCNNASCSSGTVAAQTAWVPIVVVPAAEAPSIARADDKEIVYSGELAEITWSAPELADGDTTRWVFRSVSSAWTVLPESYVWEQLAEDRMGFAYGNGTGPIWYSLQVVRDGIAIAQSEAVQVEYSYREVHLDGVRELYRQGTTMQVTPRFYPEVEGLTWTWTRWDAETSTEVTIQESANPTLEWPLTMADHDVQFRVRGIKDGVNYTPPIGGYFRPKVSDAPADQSIVVMDTLSSHYHQGSDIRLNLLVDPALGSEDTVAWEWKWPETDWAAIPGIDGVAGTLVAEQAMHGVEVRATVDFAEEGASSITVGPALIEVDDHGAAAKQTISISGDKIVDGAAAFEVGEAGSFTASLGAPTVLDTYQWFVKLPGASEAAPIHGAAAATYDFTAAALHNGAEVSVAVVKPDGSLAYGPSAPVTVAVTEGEEPISTTVTITGLEDSYEVGDTMSLTAEQNPDTGEDHWHWFIKPAGADEYTAISGELTASLNREVTADDDGASIIARLYDHDHAVIAESAPVTVSVHDDDEEPIGTTVTITGMADAYDVGDTMTLTASQEPDTGLSDWHWYLKPAGADDYSVIDGQNTATLTRDVAAGDNGASILARLFDEDHGLVAESAAVTVMVKVDEEPSGGKPGNAPADRTVADLGDTPASGIDLGAATVAPGDFLQVDLGAEHANTWTAAWLFSTPTLLAGDWLLATGSGSITVQIPADTALGDHRLAVFAADGSLIGWASLTVAQASDTGPSAGSGAGDLAVTGGTLSIAAAGMAILLTLAGTLLVAIRRRRTANE